MGDIPADWILSLVSVGLSVLTYFARSYLGRNDIEEEIEGLAAELETKIIPELYSLQVKDTDGKLWFDRGVAACVRMFLLRLHLRLHGSSDTPTYMLSATTLLFLLFVLGRFLFPDLSEEMVTRFVFLFAGVVLYLMTMLVLYLPRIVVLYWSQKAGVWE